MSFCIFLNLGITANTSKPTTTTITSTVISVAIVHSTEVAEIFVIAQISIEGVPIPGGAGISEGILHNMFVMIFASKLADVGMLLTRAFSFYIPVIGCGLIILINKIINRKK